MRIPLLSRKHRIFALIGAILIGAVGGAVYRHAHQTHTAVISLAYQSASRGLYPDGMRCDPYLATSEEVLGAAEDALGYTIPRESIWVRPSYTGRGATYATDYTITYQGADTAVLPAVVRAWESAFAAHTGANRRVTAYEAYPADMDYLDIASWLEKETEQIRYASNQRLKEDKTWAPDNAETMTYADIVSAAENIKSTSIANLRTYIVQNGISKDPETLENTIAYRNRELQKRKDQTDAQYRNRLKAIALYDSTLFPTISVPSISNGTYYVTTTRTGLDYIYDAAQEFLNNSLSIQKTITENELLLASISDHGAPSADEIADADTRISAIEQQIRDLASELGKTDSAYEAENYAPYYTVTIDGASYAQEEDTNE